MRLRHQPACPGTGLHHVLDGRTGLPTNDILATWVVADVPATALFFAAPDSPPSTASPTSASDRTAVSTRPPTSTAHSSPDRRTTPNGGSAVRSDRKFRDQNGEESATGWYGSMPNHLTVSLMLTDAVITDVTVTPLANGASSHAGTTARASAPPMTCGARWRL